MMQFKMNVPNLIFFAIAQVYELGIIYLQGKCLHQITQINNDIFKLQGLKLKKKNFRGKSS
jgi:hypothetical protein